MKKLLHLFFPLSLRVRFLLATAAVVLVLSLAYGMVALIGYSVSFDKTTVRLLRGESNLFYMLAKWENNTIDVDIPANLNMQSPTVTLIYDAHGQLLWAQHDVPWLVNRIQPEWLKNNGFHEIEADVDSSSMLQHNNHEIQQQLDQLTGQFPDSAGSPVIMQIDPDMMPVMIASADVDGMDQAEVSNYVDNELLPLLESIEGVASVTATGVLDTDLQVTMNQEKIDALNEQILRK